MAYLQKSEDLWLQAVLRHMITLSRDSSTNPVSACRFILQKYGVPMPESDDDVAYMKHRVGERQKEKLKVLRKKTIHGVHRTAEELPGWFMHMIKRWKNSGCHRGSYNSGTTQQEETIGHVLSSCEEYKWTLYKQRHNAMITVFTLAVARKWGYD